MLSPTDRNNAADKSEVQKRKTAKKKERQTDSRF
jgi:hypothetical protein